MFQSLKSHEPEFVSELVRLNEKGPLQSLQPITVPFDELAILVVCRMYHIHIGVVLNDHVWYTSSAEKPEEIAFYL